MKCKNRYVTKKQAISNPFFYIDKNSIGKIVLFVGYLKYYAFLKTLKYIKKVKIKLLEI